MLSGAMLYLVGLGLGDAADITVKGLQVVRKCSRVYLEAYTSMLTVGKEALVSRSSLSPPSTHQAENHSGRRLLISAADLVELPDACVVVVLFAIKKTTQKFLSFWPIL